MSFYLFCQEVACPEGEPIEEEVWVVRVLQPRRHSQPLHGLEFIGGVFGEGLARGSGGVRAIPASHRAEELVLQAPKDDKGRQGRGEQGDGQVGHHGGQQEDWTSVDPFPRLLVVPGPVGSN